MNKESYSITVVQHYKSEDVAYIKENKILFIKIILEVFLRIIVSFHVCQPHFHLCHTRILLSYFSA